MARTFALMLLVGLSVTSAPVVHGQCTSTTKPTAVFSSRFGTTEVFWNGGCTYTVSVHVTGSSSNIVDIRPVVDGQIIANLNILNDSGGGNLQVRVLRSADNTKTFGGLNSMPWDNRNMRPIALTTLYTSGNVGTLEVNSVNDNSLNNIIVGGNLGAIMIKPDPSPPPQASQVVSLQVSGNITGNIVNPYGSIKRLLVTGDMGTTGTPINIWAKNSIELVRSFSGSIYADVDANAYSTAADVGRIQAALVLSGAVKARKIDNIAGGGLDPGIFCGSALSSNITLDQAMDRVIIAGGDFTGNKTIKLPHQGLEGQIIFNAGNTTGDWYGEIRLNNVPLPNQPEYTDKASDVGGGSAGVARFTIHDESCKPATGVTTTGYGIDPESIVEDPPCSYYFKKATLRFYGPVNPTNTGSGTACDVTVELDTGSGYVDVTSDFKTLPVASTGDRDIKIERDDGAGWPVGAYRITRNGTRLTCKDVYLSPAVRDFTYTLTLIDNCSLDSLMAFDLNNDNSVNTLDAVEWLISPADVNRDSSTNSTDLDVLLSAIGG